MYKFKRIFAIFLSVLLLSLTVGDAFISANDISCVQATGAEFVAGAAAADAVMEFIIALLASVGAGELAVARQEAIAHGFVDYLAVSQTVNQMLGETAVRFCMSAAPVANTIQAVLWDDLLESLQNYHDSAVDTLTGIYAQYCPELIGIAKDFVEDVVTKNITIAGVTDAFSTPMTAEIVAKQWSGEPFSYVADFNYSYTVPKESSYTGEVQNVTVCGHHTADLSYPVCGQYYYDEGNNAWYFVLWRLYKGGLFSVKMTYELTCYLDGKMTQHEIHSNWTVADSTFGVNDLNPIVSFSANFPIFSSKIEAEAYLKGTGAVTDALNYSIDITDTITDNNDLPTLGDFAGELWERVANAPDCGIGAYGSGALVGDWADDIPWLGLDDLQAFVDNIQDVFDKTIEGILDGTYDLPLDIPDYTYGDAWIDAIDRTWDDVIDNPINDPAIDKPDNPAIGDKDDPITGDKDIVDEIVDADTIVPSVSSDFSDISGTLKRKFPFSLPWDVYYLFTVLADTPKTPRFEIPFYIDRLGIHEVIVLDLSPFESISKLSRLFLTLFFCYGLMNLTVKIVSVRKEE